MASYTITGFIVDDDNLNFKDTTYNNATSSTAGLMSSTDKERLDGVVQEISTYQSVTFTPGNNVTINSQACFRYMKLLFVYMRWTATSTISAYGPIASSNYSVKTWWNAPLMNDSNAIVANNGIYGDQGNYQIRASLNISAGTYRTYVVIPIT